MKSEMFNNYLYVGYVKNYVYITDLVFTKKTKAYMDESMITSLDILI